MEYLAEGVVQEPGFESREEKQLGVWEVKPHLNSIVLYEYMYSRYKFNRTVFNRCNVKEAIHNANLIFKALLHITRRGT